MPLIASIQRDLFWVCCCAAAPFSNWRSLGLEKRRPDQTMMASRVAKKLRLNSVRDSKWINNLSELPDNRKSTHPRCFRDSNCPIVCPVAPGGAP